MNFRSRNYASDLRNDIGALQTTLRYLRGESLDPQTKDRVIANLSTTVERELARLQHALAALSADGEYEAPAGFKPIKSPGAQARAKVRWAVERLQDKLRSLEGGKKHDLEKFLEQVKSKRKEITSVKNRAEMKLNAPKWQALLAEIEKKEAALNSATGAIEEKTGRRFRGDD